MIWDIIVKCWNVSFLEIENSSVEIKHEHSFNSRIENHNWPKSQRWPNLSYSKCEKYWP